MTTKTRLLAAATLVIFLAVTLQTVFVARLNLPGAGPDLLLLAVLAIGLATSPNFGALAGFATGLLVDILPPDQTTLGVTAIVLTLVGYFAGTIGDPRGLAPLQLLGILIVLAAATGMTYVLVAALIEGRVMDQEQAVWSVVAATAYTSILGLLIVPPIHRWLTRMSERLSRRPSTSEPIPVGSKLGSWGR